MDSKYDDNFPECNRGVSGKGVNTIAVEVWQKEKYDYNLRDYASCFVQLSQRKANERNASQ